MRSEWRSVCSCGWCAGAWQGVGLESAGFQTFGFLAVKCTCQDSCEVHAPSCMEHGSTVLWTEEPSINASREHRELAREQL